MKTSPERTMDDEALIEQYRRTKEKSPLDELLRRNFDRIYRFVGSMVADRNAVDDLVQDVLLSILRNFDGFRGDSRFSTWIYRIAVNRVYRHFETIATKPIAYDNESLELESTENTAQAAELKELNEIIGDAVAELSPALRSAMLLTGVEGFSAEEAAEIENCSSANIHWRVHRARKILKAKLTKYLE